MQLIKLDKKRSLGKHYVNYYQINDSNEVCVKVNKPDDTEKIQERICVPPVNDNSNFAQLHKDDRIPEGEYQVTTMLIDIDNYHSDTNVSIPDFIQRVYYSGKPSIKIPTLKISQNNPYFVCGRPLWGDDKDIYSAYSKDKTELFKYITDSDNKGKDVNLPVGLVTIHSYAFVNSEIGTLRIPATVTEIGTCAFWNAKITNIIFDGKWTEDIDPEAFTNLKVSGNIRINDTAQNVSSYNELLNAVGSDCNRLILAAPHPCEEVSPSIGYIRVTQAYYHNRYPSRWNNIIHNEGIIDINTRYIVSVKDYEIPTYIPVKGSYITLYGNDNDNQHYGIIVYEPKEMVLEKIDAAVKQINATGCTVDELIDRIKNKIK